ncbi:hypothetical protein D3C73_1535780 [compost metagenome]
MKMMPFRTQSASSVRWNQRSRLILVGGFLVLMKPLLFRVQFAAGRVVVRTCQPERMIRTIKNMFRKCCHPSQAGKPVGAPSGTAECPG